MLGMENNYEYVVVDSSMIIRCERFHNKSKKVVTVPEVLDELKCAHSRNNFSLSPNEIKVISPSDESINFVKKFARMTGDLKSLSSVDIKIIALVYELEAKYCDPQHIRAKPVIPVAYSAKNKGNTHIDNSSKQIVTDTASVNTLASEISGKLSIEEPSVVDNMTTDISGKLSIEEPNVVENLATDISGKLSIEKPNVVGNLATEISGKLLIEEPNVVDNFATEISGKLSIEEPNVVDHLATDISGKLSIEEPNVVDNVTSDISGKLSIEEPNVVDNVATDISGKLSIEEPSVVDNVATDISGKDSIEDTKDVKDTEDSQKLQNEKNLKTQKLPKSDKTPGFFNPKTDKNFDDGWITPSNISKTQDQNTKVSLKDLGMDASCIKVVCAVGDFAMQNVILHMGLHAISSDGLFITKLKTYTLKCITCGKIENDVLKEFCNGCGYRTLQKISCMISADGKGFVYQKFTRTLKKPDNSKCYTINVVKKNGDVIKNEEQLKRRRYLNKSKLDNNKNSKKNNNTFSNLYASDVFSQRDTTCRAFQRGYHLKKNNVY